MNIDKVLSPLWGLGGLISLIVGVIGDDIQFIILGILCFILSYVVKLCVLSEKAE